MSRENSSRSILSFGVVLRGSVIVTSFLGALWFGRGMRGVDGESHDVGMRILNDSVVTPNQEHGNLTASAALPLYLSYCAKCHGADGHGAPGSLLRLNPPPRDFSGNRWRFPKTHTGIQHVIRHGVTGTAMPSMASQFSDAQVAQLANHVLSLSRQPAAVSQTGQYPEHLRQLSDLGFNLSASPQPSTDLSLKTTSGRSFNLKDARGKVILLHFWGTECVHCLKEMPFVANLQRQFAHSGLLVLSLCADEDDPNVVHETAGAFAAGHVVYRDPTGLAVQRFDVTSLPAFVIIDRHQNIVATKKGAILWGDGRSDAAFESLLNSDEDDF